MWYLNASNVHSVISPTLNSEISSNSSLNDISMSPEVLPMHIYIYIYIYHVIIGYKANNHHMFVILIKRNILYKFTTSLGNKYTTIINIVIIILWNKLEKEIFLAPNMFGVIFFQTTMWRLKRASMCDFNYLNLLMSHMTCLNNTHG